jgi:hypothetical protein
MSHEVELSALLTENRRFPPPAEFSAQANAQPEIYARAQLDPLAFWAAEASRLQWERPWDTPNPRGGPPGAPPPRRRRERRTSRVPLDRRTRG